MSMLRRSGAVLALILTAGIPAMTGLARAQTAAASPVAALRELHVAERDLAHGRRIAAESWLERAETAVLNRRSELQGQSESGPRVAALDHVVATIGEARMDARQGHLPQAGEKAAEARQALRGA
ncbi:hypothetical protein [Siccirubricoccus phaeus]|uniref:hypothetical protein n=1 Tax=Siccirubricoccus phaeus TaxID=2595053 RepID=UPI0011F3598C|nr:hypothetical protein [Siccirubricoccus phaeus]